MLQAQHFHGDGPFCKLKDWLNEIQFFGFKFGFWWAQQGSIYVFVILIFVYTAMMKKIDKEHGVSDEDDE